VKHPPLAVTSFLTQIVFFVRGVITFAELNAEADQFLDPGGAVGDDIQHDLFATESVTGFQGIPHVHLKGIFLRSDTGNPPLGVVGIGFRPILFRNDEDRTTLREFNRTGQPGDPAPQNHKIHFFHD